MVWNISMLTVLSPLLLLLIGLTFTVVIDPYIQRKHRKIMLAVIVLCFVLMVQNILENELAFGLFRPRARTLVAIYGYAARPVFLVLFLYIVQPKGKHWIWWILVDLNAAVYATALFSDICFKINETNHYIGGPLANVALYVSAVLLVNLFIQSIRNFRGAGNKEKWIPIYVVVMIIASVIMDGRVSWESQPVTFLTISIIVGTVFYYIWLHLQFVREHETALQENTQSAREE